ncbi:MAG: rRNA adenine N-6-methyltransferase family protein, partial [Thermoplasmatota archaeon]
TEDYGRLTVMAAARAAVEIVERVPPGVFSPPPRVDSALVRLAPREPPLAVGDAKVFADVVARAFSQRRKKLSNALDWREAPHGDRRAGELSPEEFAQVAAAWVQRAPL